MISRIQYLMLLLFYLPELKSVDISDLLVVMYRNVRLAVALYVEMMGCADLQMVMPYKVLRD